MAGPGRPVGLPKSGGRQKGSTDKQKRQLMGQKLLNDVMRAYKAQGPDFLIQFAKESPRDFVALLLTRVLPAPLRDEPEVQVTSNQLNIDMSSPNAQRDIACRIAYLLAKGLHAAEPDLIDPVTPQQACRVDPQPVQPQSRYTPPEVPEQPSRPVDGDAYQRWVEGLALTDEERADRDCAEQPHHGSAEEQGLVRRKKLL